MYEKCLNSDSNMTNVTDYIHVFVDIYFDVVHRNSGYILFYEDKLYPVVGGK